MATSVIDLGPTDLEHAWDPGEVERAPLRLSRGWGMFATFVVLASLTSAAVPPPQPRELSRYRLGAGTYQLLGGTVFALESSNGPGRVVALDATTGKLRWAVDPENSFAFAHIEWAGPVALFSAEPCVSGAVGRTVALDVATGRQLWAEPGAPLTTPRNFPVSVITHGTYTDRCGAMAGNGQSLSGQLQWQGVDRFTGATAWQRVAQVGTRLAVDRSPDGSTWGVLLEPTGELSTVDFADGSVSAPVAGLAEPGADRLAGLGDNVLIMHELPKDGIVTITAYDRRSIQRRWRLDLPVANQGNGSRLDRLQVRACGRLICLNADETHAIAPDTGAVLWHGRTGLYGSAAGLLVADYSMGTAPSWTRRLTVLDPLTGRPGADLSGWRLLGADAHGDRTVVGILDDSTTLLAWLAPGGVPRPFATVQHTLVGCAADVTRLVCQTDADELLIWRLAA